MLICAILPDLSLSLRRAWIEISINRRKCRFHRRRSPYGERGLKCAHARQVRRLVQSLSLRRAWIEIGLRLHVHRVWGSLSLRRAWIEMNMGVKKGMVNKSLSLRRAWIEILPSTLNPTEGASLSLRRAWIEIISKGKLSWLLSRRSPYGERGLKCKRKPHIRHGRSRSPYGERGLKYVRRDRVHAGDQSLSLRRAWIEIPFFRSCTVRPEGRSPYGERGLKFELDVELGGHVRRSPYGERGLKYRWRWKCSADRGSLSLRRAWIEIGRASPRNRTRTVALLTESVD